MPRKKRACLNEQNTKDPFGDIGLLQHLTNHQRSTQTEIQDIPIHQLLPNPYQPRETFSSEALQELAQSIKEQGFYGHLWARQKGRKYELAFGERRLRAAKIAELDALPIHIRPLTNEQMLEIALGENIQREDLHPIEEAHALQRMQHDLGYSVRKIAKKTGKSIGYIASLLSLLRYNDISEAMKQHPIPVRTAEELAKFPDDMQRKKLLNKVIHETIGRNQLISIRKGHPANVRNANTASSPQFIPAFHRTIGLLQKDIEHIPIEQRQKTAQLLRTLIEEASAFLEKLSIPS